MYIIYIIWDVTLPCVCYISLHWRYMLLYMTIYVTLLCWRYMLLYLCRVCGTTHLHRSGFSHLRCTKVSILQVVVYFHTIPLSVTFSSVTFPLKLTLYRRTPSVGLETFLRCRIWSITNIYSFLSTSKPFKYVKIEF